MRQRCIYYQRLIWPTGVQVSESIMREELIQSVLSDLNGGSADIEASAIISTDGLTIGSALSSTAHSGDRGQ